MEKISYWRLIGEIERIVKTCVPGRHPERWTEEVVVESLLKNLCGDLNDTDITGFRQEYSIQLSAYRQRSRNEPAGADLSLLVRVRRKDGSVLEGAAFLDTLLKQDRKRTFEGFRLPEVKKLFRSSPFSQALLLDYEDITSYSSNRSTQFPPMEYSPWRGGVPVTPCTHAVLIPANVVIAQRLNDTSIYGFSTPLSSQLVYRYFHGFDLDLSEQAVAAARGQPTKKGLSEYLVCFSVSEDGVEPEGDPDINRRVWENLE